MKKALGLALLASLFAAPAFAGEVYVRNENSRSDSNTVTNLNLDSGTESIRIENYSEIASKTYSDGSVSTQYSNYCDYYYGCGSTSSTTYTDFTTHNASTSLNGSFEENKYANVAGTISTTTNAYTDGHETSAGVR